MLCRDCGGPTKVAETRADDHKIVNRRRRICQDCGSSFWTFEIDDMVAKTIVGRIMATHQEAVLRRRSRGRRRLQIVERLLAGEKVTALAAELGMSQSSVSRAGNSAGVYSRGPYRKGSAR